MNKLILSHHSISDWDWQHGASYRSLDPVTFVVAPSSLKFQVAGGTQVHSTALLRAAMLQCIPQGELRTWYRCYVPSGYFMNFRNQAPLGSASYVNCYEFQAGSTVITFRRNLGGGYTIIGTYPMTFSSNTWYHFRTRWWNGNDPGGNPALCVDLYVEIAGNWSKLGSTLYDTTNSWAGSAVNRVGLSLFSIANWQTNYDETEIWTP